MEGEVDRRLLKAVAEALRRGQFDCSQEEVAEAYQQVKGALINGAAAEMVLQGRVDLALKDGEIQYVKPLTAADDDGSADRPLDPYRAARDKGGIVALDLWPRPGVPVMLLAEQLPDPAGLDDDAPQECFAFTFVDLNHNSALLSFSVPLGDLMRLVAQAPLSSPTANDGKQPPAAD